MQRMLIAVFGSRPAAELGVVLIGVFVMILLAYQPHIPRAMTMAMTITLGLMGKDILPILVRRVATEQEEYKNSASEAKKTYN